MAQGERTALAKPLADLIGTVIAGRYIVERCIGVGGMAVVFRGRHKTLDRPVAIKVLRPELMKHLEVVGRFDREARAASHFEHPNCIQVFDAGTSANGLKFMVMPFLRGRELARVLRQRLPPSQAASLCCQVLRGLDYAHRKGVVHRDLKPDNVFVIRDHEKRELLKVVDFGIAKLLADAAADGVTTKVGAIVGTPAYMSPEQALGDDVDARADLYAVGVMLFQMMTGKLPFDSADTRALLYQHVSRPPPPLPAYVSSDLRAIVDQLLAKRRDDRPPTAAHALEALEQVTRGLSNDPTPWIPLLGPRSSTRPIPPPPGHRTTGGTLVAPPSPHRTSDTDLYGSRAGSVHPGSKQAPRGARPARAKARAATPDAEEVEKMNEALDNILATEEEMEKALRSGIFDAPPGGWDIDDELELEPDPDAESPASPRRGEDI